MISKLQVPSLAAEELSEGENLILFVEGLRFTGSNGMLLPTNLSHQSPIRALCSVPGRARLVFGAALLRTPFIECPVVPPAIPSSVARLVLPIDDQYSV